MNFMPRWAWLQQAVRPAPSTPEGPDAADMGTAFGLDASFRDEPDARLEPKPLTAAPWLSRHTGLPRRN
ncbi:MAG: hypothetical protein ABW067_03120 [Rhizobacter sp.]